MGRKCTISGCTSGYKSNRQRVSLFRFPKNEELRAKWMRAIPATNIAVSNNSCICEKHFLPTDIKRSYVEKDANGRIIIDFVYLHPSLMESAVPSIFSLTQAHCTYENKHISGKSKAAACGPDADTTVPSAGRNPLKPSDIVGDGVRPASNLSPHPIERNSTVYVPMPPLEPTPSDMPDTSCHKAVLAEDRTQESQSFKHMFSDIFEKENAVSIPAGWFRCIPSDGKKCVAFSTYGTKAESHNVQPILRKSVVVSEDGNAHMSAIGKTIPVSSICRSLSKVNSVRERSRLLAKFHSTNLCTGMELSHNSLTKNNLLYQDAFGKWHHNNCGVLSTGGTCSMCQSLKSLITQKKLWLIKRSSRTTTDLRNKRPNEKSKVTSLRKQLKSQRAVGRRANLRVKKLQDEVSLLQNHIRKSKEDRIVEKCNRMNLSQARQLCVKEIMAAGAKKNPQGNRYTKDWMMLCALMHKRSPAHYRLLLKNDILPLPAQRTIRRYLSVVNTQAGFDKSFCAIVQKHLEGKSTVDKDSIVDDVSLGESMSACSSSLTREGLTDADDAGSAATDANEQAAHGRVHISSRRAVTDVRTQPVADFATEELAKGTEIILSENVGATIDGIISEDETTGKCGAR